MRSEEPSPFTPPETGRAPLVLIALALGAAAFAAWHFGAKAPSQAPSASAPKPSVGSVSRGAEERQPPAPEARSVPSAPAPAPSAPLAWVRCEANGRVVYSDSGCAGVGTQRASSADTRAAVSTLPSGAGGQRTTTLYRCKAFSGAVTWSAARCDPNKALIERMVSVPQGLSLQQQIRAAERSSAPVQTASAAAGPPTPPRAEATGEALRQRECRYLDEHIRHLDARARQALSAQEQDWVREKRRAARDRQFALHC